MTGWLLALIGVIGWLIGLLVWAMRVASRRRFYGSLYGLRSVVVGDLGLSVLVPTDADAEQVAALMRIDYERCEVVVVLDGVRDEALLRLLVSRYRLIRVAYRPAEELPTVPVEALYRSRVRLFRRLVVLDVRYGRRAERLDAAAEVAACELLLPMPRGCVVQEGVVEWLVAEADRAVVRAPEAWSLGLLGEVVCYRRSAVVRVGGFAHTRRLRRRWLPACVTRRFRATNAPCRLWQRLRGVLLVGVSGVAWSLGGGALMLAVSGCCVSTWLLLRRLVRVAACEAESRDWSPGSVRQQKSEAKG